MEVHFPHIAHGLTDKLEPQRRRTALLRRIVSYAILTSALVSFIIFSQ